MKLPEQILLLSLHDEKGSVLMSASSALPYALAGALLLELHFSGKIELKDGRLKLLDASHTDDELLNEAIDLMTQTRKIKKAGYWVERINSKIKNIRKRLLLRLVDAGILKEDHRKFLWLIPYNRYPAENPSPELSIRHNIRQIVLYGTKPDDHMAALISLVRACNLENEIFEREELKQAKRRIRDISQGEDIGKAVTDVTQAMTAAVAGAVAAATVAAAGSSSSSG